METAKRDAEQIKSNQSQSLHRMQTNRKRDAELEIQSNQSQSLHRMQTTRSTEKAELGMKDDLYTRDQKKPYNSSLSKQDDKGGDQNFVSLLWQVKTYKREMLLSQCHLFQVW
ncbi:DNA excision repair protein ERCC-8-like X4 [Biomphalaria pfeifferi]|uniref:DNA excision repair protein ERCC-8-like X4 n=1 Tax=Biomphalaria pfeifferi TaxID=112525 RepID=A0AAD8BZG9_BIOPF|nr:DNA excision repair protein ERCC-8-like X4 [Biomphalaria pfeifferi]